MAARLPRRPFRATSHDQSRLNVPPHFPSGENRKSLEVGFLENNHLQRDIGGNKINWNFARERECEQEFFLFR